MIRIISQEAVDDLRINEVTVDGNTFNVAPDITMTAVCQELLVDYTIPDSFFTSPATCALSAVK